MSGSELFQVLASAVSIVDCSVRLFEFIRKLNDDVHDIRDWLVETRDGIETLVSVLELVKTIATGPNMIHAEDGPIKWICTIVRVCNDRAEKIYEKLPPIPENDVFSKVEAVLRKLMHDREIKEHEVVIQKWTGLLQTTVVALSLERTSSLARIYENHQYHDDDKFEGIRVKLSETLSSSIPSSRTTSQYDPSETASVLIEKPLPILYRAWQPELKQSQDKVEELELEKRYLEAAMEQGKIIEMRRSLENYTPFSGQYEAQLVERQADLLLRCPTIGRHHEAAKLLRILIEDRNNRWELTDKAKGRVMLKLGEWYLAEAKRGHTAKTKLATTILSDAATLLEGLHPFPRELYERSVVLFVSTLENPEDVRVMKSHVEERILPGPDTVFEWEYAGEPECEALKWCRAQTDPAFAVDSPNFKFDGPVQGTSAMHLAVRDGRADVLRKMLVEVEHIDALDNNGCTPLLVAAAQRRSEIFELLLSRHASLDMVDKLGQTVLHKCQTPRRNDRDLAIAELVHELVRDRESAYINIRELAGKTALWMACEMSNKRMVEFLLDHGADPNIPSAINKTPLQVAVDMRSSPATQERHADRLRIIELLLEHGAESNQEDNLGNTPLHTAAFKGDLEVVRCLLDPNYKTSVDLPGRNGQTPVAAAAQQQYIPVIKELVSKGANTASKGIHQKSAEDWAKGDHNKRVRDALRPGHDRRSSRASTTSHTGSSVSSGSVKTRHSSTSQTFPSIFRLGD